MIQFNLLPDVKLQYVKARRMQHVAVVVSAIATIVAIVVLLFSVFFVDVVQKKSLKDLNSDIKKYTAQVEKTPSLNKVLTIQNQLNSINSLEASRPEVSRVFGYITQLTPSAATIDTFNLDISANNMTISGQANNLTTVDQFVDTLKFTTYSAGNGVILSGFGLPAPGASGSSYSISTDFTPAIFNASENVTLSVPNIISTRSETDQPVGLFSQPTSTQTNSSSTQ
jgi:hypothetical protein